LLRCKSVNTFADFPGFQFKAVHKRLDSSSGYDDAKTSATLSEDQYLGTGSPWAEIRNMHTIPAGPYYSSGTGTGGLETGGLETGGLETGGPVKNGVVLYSDS
jgi:hypothetical protein